MAAFMILWDLDPPPPILGFCAPRSQNPSYTVLLDLTNLISPKEPLVC